MSSESDPRTKMTFSFTSDQESFQKEVKRGFGALMLKFLALLHPINLRSQDNIYCLVLASILMHNMIVGGRIESGEVECASMYSSVIGTVQESSNVAVGTDEAVDETVED